MNPRPDIDPPVSHPRTPDKRLPIGSCDAHAHLFGPAGRYPYSAERTYTPHDVSRERYAQLLHTMGFTRAVLVQPSVYGTDNQLVMDALVESRTAPMDIAWRAVAVVDPRVSDATLEALNESGVRGIRFNLLFPGARLGLEDARVLAPRIADLGWHIQFLIDITTTPGWQAFVETSPADVVIDHLGHFPASMGTHHAHFHDMLSLLDSGRLWIKLSGPNRLSAHPTAPFTDVQAIAENLIDRRPDRLVFGTDWPHTALSTPMPDDGDLIDEFYRWIDGDEALERAILVDNPARLYQF